ncbi:MAG: MFS transporter [Fretibacterium sp.]|nr:MFS transporter [Fretibacterium sp.]
MSKKNQFALLLTRRFLPLFLTQFLGAFNDNFFKSSLLMLITFRLADSVGMDSRILVNVAAGVFILPFFLLSAPAGELADRYDRSRYMQAVKLAEIVAMALAALGFYLRNLWFLLVVLFLMGAQSTFFSPAKYSILPQHLEEDELIAGNGLIQMGTYLAILTGTIFGGISILRPNGELIVSVTVVLIATLGWLCSFYIPPTQPIDPNRRVTPNFIRATAQIVLDVVPRREIFWPIISISWFWLVGATFLAQFPTYTRLVLGADEQVATLFMAIFSVGIGLGSIACDTILKGKISNRYVPAAAAGIAVAGMLLYFVSLRPPLAPEAPVIGIWTFLRSPANLSIVMTLLFIAFCGGLYIVPLYATIQNRTESERMADVIACTNVVDSLFMALSALFSGLLIAAGMDIPQLFLFVSFLTAVAAAFVRRQVRREEREEKRVEG